MKSICFKKDLLVKIELVQFSYGYNSFPLLAWMHIFFNNFGVELVEILFWAPPHWKFRLTKRKKIVHGNPNKETRKPYFFFFFSFLGMCANNWNFMIFLKYLFYGYKSHFYCRCSIKFLPFELNEFVLFSFFFLFFNFKKKIMLCLFWINFQ